MFFSEALITNLESQLGHARIAKLITSIEADVTRRRRISLDPLITEPVSPLGVFLNEEVPATERRVYVECKFDER